MNTPDGDRLEQNTDRAVRALKAQPVPAGPPAEVVAAVLAAGAADGSRKPLTLRDRIRRMNKFIKYPVAAGMTLAVLAGAFYLVLGHSNDIAFADIKEKLEKAETVTADQSVQVPGQPEPMIIKVYYKQPGLIRQELPEGMVNVVDVDKGRVVTLVPSSKQAVITEWGDLNKVDPKMRQHFDFIGYTRRLMQGQKEDLGKKDIQGKEAVGYRLKETRGTLTTTMEVWVDARTGDFLRIDTAGGGMPTSMWNIVLNAKLDDALFSQEIPKDYQVQTQKNDLGQSSEKDLLDGLRLVAKGNGGVFPASLEMAELMKTLHAALKDVPPEQRQEQLQKAVRMAIFKTMVQKKAKEFRYFGDGVKLDEKGRAIMWWLPEDAKEYRVVFADLHAEDVAPDKLPAIEPAPSPPSPAPSPTQS